MTALFVPCPAMGASLALQHHSCSYIVEVMIDEARFTSGPVLIPEPPAVADPRPFSA